MKKIVIFICRRMSAKERQEVVKEMFTDLSTFWKEGMIRALITDMIPAYHLKKRPRKVVVA